MNKLLKGAGEVVSYYAQAIAGLILVGIPVGAFMLLLEYMKYHVGE